mgnify:CR=1 FL=1
MDGSFHIDDPLEIPAFMDRRGEPKKRRTGVRKNKIRWKMTPAIRPTSARWQSATRVTVHLDGQCPRLGCGRRHLWALIGRKWVYLADCAGGRAKMKKTEFERVRV